MSTATTSPKVLRLLNEARVMPAGAAAIYEVKGDHGEYRVILGDGFTHCDCPALRERCSHVESAEILHAGLVAQRVAKHRDRTIDRADLTLYVVEHGGGADMGGESRLALGIDDADRVVRELSADALVVTGTPLPWGSTDELDALWLVDDVNAVLADVFRHADSLGLDHEPERCDPYALLLAVRGAAT